MVRLAESYVNEYQGEQSKYRDELARKKAAETKGKGKR
jgi:hypothetical protein